MRTTNKNMVRLDLLRINRSKEKDCQCPLPTYEIDIANERCTCLECGAILPHFQVIKTMALNHETINQVHADQVAEIQAERELLGAERVAIQKERDELEALRRQVLSSEPVNAKKNDLLKESRWAKLRGRI